MRPGKEGSEKCLAKEGGSSSEGSFLCKAGCPSLTQRAEMERGREGEHEKGKQTVNVNFHCCRMQPTQAVPPPAPTRPVAAPSQPTVALTTTVTGAKIRVLGTFCMSLAGWDLDVSTVQTPGDKQCGPVWCFWGQGGRGGKQTLKT